MQAKVNEMRFYSAFLQALEEILGKHNQEQILSVANVPRAALGDEGSWKPAWIFQSLIALSEIYGSPSGCGLAHRVGRAFLRHGLRDLKQFLPLKTMDFRLLPTLRKIQTGLQYLNEALNQEIGQDARIESHSEYDMWQVNCPFPKKEPFVCWYIGILQEALNIFSHGSFFRIEVVAPSVLPNSSQITLHIWKMPMDY